MHFNYYALCCQILRIDVLELNWVDFIFIKTLMKYNITFIRINGENFILKTKNSVLGIKSL